MRKDTNDAIGLRIFVDRVIEYNIDQHLKKPERLIARLERCIKDANSCKESTLNGRVFWYGSWWSMGQSLIMLDHLKHVAGKFEMNEKMKKLIKKHDKERLISERSKGHPFSTLFMEDDMMTFVSQMILSSPNFYVENGAIDALAETRVFNQICDDMKQGSTKFVGKSFLIIATKWMIDALDDDFCDALGLPYGMPFKPDDDVDTLPKTSGNDTIEKIISDIAKHVEHHDFGEPLTSVLTSDEARIYSGRIMSLAPDDWITGGVLENFDSEDFWVRQANRFINARDFGGIGADVSRALSDDVMCSDYIIALVDEHLASENECVCFERE